MKLSSELLEGYSLVAASRSVLAGCQGASTARRARQVVQGSGLGAVEFRVILVHHDPELSCPFLAFGFFKESKNRIDKGCSMKVIILVDTNPGGHCRLEVGNLERESPGTFPRQVRTSAPPLSYWVQSRACQWGLYRKELPTNNPKRPMLLTMLVMSPWASG